MHDIVGDIHGHAEALEALLDKLGYRARNGAWRHPERHMVFLGDLIDRGPGQLETIDIVRRMRDAGSASVVMGNHEWNAIGYATERPDRPGRYHRIRGSKNTAQHQAFLDAVAETDGALHRELICWFKTIPLWTDFGPFRAVHACWHPDSLAIVARHARSDNTLDDDAVHAAFEKDTELYDGVEVLLKGVEVPLPDGVVFRDKDGHERRNTRVRWWDDRATTYRTAALVDPSTAAQLPDVPLPESARVPYDDEKPVFFGHYWAVGEPVVFAPRKACLDFSVAKDGYLTSYRHDGEDHLSQDKLVWVSASPEPTPRP